MVTEEQIAIVDENDKIIGKSTISEVHSKGLLHREIFVYFINSKKQILLQQRTDNEKWDHSVGGHFSIEESYLDGAQRETEEELGIKIPKKEFVEITYEKLERIKPNTINRRFVKIFVVKKDIPIEKFKIQEDELADLKYFNEEELNKLEKNNTISTTCKEIIHKYILELI